MDLPRVFLSPACLNDGVATLPEEEVGHLTRVLRMGVGDRLFLLDGQGALYLAELTEVSKRAATARILSKEAAKGELRVSVTLVQGLPKGEKFDWILQKATELGVHRIQPVMTERTVVKLEKGRAEDKLRRWGAIAKEAAEQCERARVPLIETPLDLAAWCARPAEPGTLRLACLERSEATPLLQVDLAGCTSVEVVVGPEGGFAPREAEALVAAGARPVSLGSRVLRTETASLAALSLLSAKLEG